MTITFKEWRKFTLTVGEMSLEYRTDFGWWLAREDGEGAQIQSEEVERMLSEFLSEVM